MRAAGALMVRKLFGQAKAFVGGIAPHHHASVGWWALKVLASRGQPDKIISATVEAVSDLNDDIIAKERDERPQPPPEAYLG
jgi:hypothetical protein